VRWEPLDSPYALEAFAEEQERRNSHAATINKLRDALQNAWFQSIVQLINEINPRLEKHRVQLGPVERSVNTEPVTVMVRGTRPRSLTIFDPLLFELKNDATVYASAQRSRRVNLAYRPRLIGSDPEFPTAAIEEALADYVGFCLRASG
jgi:hypothetical protein